MSRTVILNAGDLFAEAIDVDLSVISASDGFDQPQVLTTSHQLEERPVFFFSVTD